MKKITTYHMERLLFYLEGVDVDSWYHHESKEEAHKMYNEIHEWVVGLIESTASNACTEELL